MAHSTVAPEDEYDVFIQDDVGDSDTDQRHQYDPEFLSAQQLLLLCSTVFTVGFLGNVLVLFILVKYKGFKHVGNIYFLNLTLSHLCFLLPLPFWAHAAATHGGSPGEPTCKFLLGLQWASLQAEALFTILLVVQGSWGCLRMKWLSSALRTVSGGIITSVLAWTVAILAALPEFVFYKLQTGWRKYKCAFSRSYFFPGEEPFWKHFLTLKMNILVLVCPLSVFIVCSVQARKTQSLGERHCHLRKLVFVIMGIFLLMWAPYNVALFLYAFQEHLSLQERSYSLDTSVQVTRIIASVHCCVNPPLYLLLDKDIRKCLCGLTSWCKGKGVPFQPSIHSATPKEGHDQSTEL